MTDAVLGLAGGDGGEEIKGLVVPEGTKISAIYVLTGLYIDTLEIAYQGESGEVQLGPAGGFGGIPHAFVLGEDEYLTGISGRNGIYVDSIRFHTNLRTSDTYGGPFGAADFAFYAPEGSHIVGFVGRAGWFIDALGIITRSLPAAPKARRTRAAKTEPATKAETVPVAVAEEAPKAKRRRKAAEAVAVAEEAPKTKKAARAKKTEASTEAAPKAKKAPGRKKAVKAEAAAPAEVQAEVPVEAPAEAPAEATRGGALQLPEIVERQPNSVDLQKVEGIGPKIADMLIANGIYDLGDLAATPVAQLREIMDAAGPRYRIADPTTWPEQAALGAAGDWEAFNALTAQLKRGRRV
jgi:predicted flap endonuclease-1-like 5' DNA nuclease